VGKSGRKWRIVGNNGTLSVRTGILSVQDRVKSMKL